MSSWSSDTSRLNSTYLRIAKQAGVTSNPPQSRPISQASLQKSAREASVICNQGAGFNHCLFKAQQGMQTQVKAIRTKGKGKSASRVATATDELQYFMDFNARISQAMAKTMKHLSDFVFVSMANLTQKRCLSVTCKVCNQAGYISSTENCSPATGYLLPRRCD